MRIFVVILSLIFAHSSFAAKKNKVDSCAIALTRPFDQFFSQVDLIRKTETDSKKTNIKITKLELEAEFFQCLPMSLRWSMTQKLSDPKNSALSARQICANELKNKKISLADLEKKFDPERVVELDIDAAQVPEVLSGQKTVTFRKDNRFEYKSGPGLLRVSGTDQEIPITIEQVYFRKRVTDLNESDLSRLGPFIKELIKKKGIHEAREKLIKALQSYYPDFDPDEDDLTVVYFERVLH